MIISPTKVIEEGWVKDLNNPDKEFDKDLIQPNGIDFRLMKLYAPKCNNFYPFKLCADDTKTHIKYEERKCNIFTISPGESFDCQTNLEVKIPSEVMALLYTRSTLIRNGLFLTSGVYDSGYFGNVGCHLHSIHNSAEIEKGARIGQIVFYQANASTSLYNGSYNNWQRE